MSASAEKGDWPCSSSWKPANRIFSGTVNSAIAFTLPPCDPRKDASAGHFNCAVVGVGVARGFDAAKGKDSCGGWRTRYNRRAGSWHENPNEDMREEGGFSFVLLRSVALSTRLSFLKLLIYEGASMLFDLFFPLAFQGIAGRICNDDD